MTSVEELVLELESLQGVLALILLEEDLWTPFTKVLSQLVGTMITILKNTMSKDSLETIEALSSGDTI